MKSRFHQLPEILAQTYKNGHFQELQTMAAEYLDLAARHKTDWNYGNAIHQANIYLGLIALEHQETEKAKTFLLKAGQTPGSPQLNNFGPNMLLAKKLLELGEKKVVLQYIDGCKKFWKAVFRFFPINKWKKAIKEDEIPDFKAHLIYHIWHPANETTSRD